MCPRRPDGSMPANQLKLTRKEHQQGGSCNSQPDLPSWKKASHLLGAVLPCVLRLAPEWEIRTTAPAAAPSPISQRPVCNIGTASDQCVGCGAWPTALS